MKFSLNILEHGVDYLSQIIAYNETDSVKQWPEQRVDLTNAESVLEATTWIDRDDFDDEVIEQIVKCVLFLNTLLEAE
jgi:hypothetical protein